MSRIQVIEPYAYNYEPSEEQVIISFIHKLKADLWDKYFKCCTPSITHSVNVFSAMEEGNNAR